MVDPWLLSALGMGLASSLTVCTVACLPFIGSWVLGRGAAPAASVADVGWFLLGRWSAYALLGGGVALLGLGWGKVLPPTLLHGVAGGLFLWSGWQLWFPSQGHCSGHGRGWPPFQLGLAQALTPCAPLTSLLGMCALAGSPLNGLAMGAAFGLGAMVSPLLLLAPLMAGAGQALGAHLQGRIPWLRGVGGCALILLGLRQWGLAA